MSDIAFPYMVISARMRFESQLLNVRRILFDLTVSQALINGFPIAQLWTPR